MSLKIQRSIEKKVAQNELMLIQSQQIRHNYFHSHQALSEKISPFKIANLEELKKYFQYRKKHF